MSKQDTKPGYVKESRAKAKSPDVMTRQRQRAEDRRHASRSHGRQWREQFAVLQARRQQRAAA